MAKPPLGDDAQTILDNISDGLLAISHEWQLIYLNRPAAELLCREPGELLGKSVWDEFPELSDNVFGAAYRRVAATRVAENLTGLYANNRRWYDLRVCPAADGISVYFTDVTCQKLAEEDRQLLVADIELRCRMYETVLSNSADFNYILDLQGRFSYANSKLLAAHYTSMPALLGQNFFDLGYPQALAERLHKQINIVLDTSQPVRDEAAYFSIQGERHYEYIFVPVFDSIGTVVAVSGSTRDVTKRRQAEEELRRTDQRKDEFLAILAHELRNPLASLSSWLEIMLRSPADPVLAARGPVIMARQVAQLVRLVDDLMDLSRISRGVVNLRKERVELASVVQQAVETVQHLMSKASHRLDVQLPSEPIPVVVDGVRLVQIMTNLLNNAIKFTPPGGRISLAVERRAQLLEMTVSDNGIGIAVDRQARVFDMFTHADVSISRTHGGLGIGLSVVRGLVELHGGSVDLYSAGSGLGSRFTVSLPVGHN